ncbi:dipeptide/oligopeptide/nickel ABC transporter permease/ATP-binding protein [Actinomadura sp. KC216]|uniref:dipeptide/oligopeptide/nickel ABC transporter permease/ATP-binding protein n=1 Tax=Actinomadura sp. KC216 TaxID=2530370 RepID=UPI00104FD7A4|nr:dipeptide/oligopeptide/nickel ABC transporter permease/ATP-binding protein [Actinomadura sp. KC216]TDB87906.1 dipeptide/oligopeptide/nickel ABC transporter permease/ATP-binding protein [Actinomadura sp. KC216]
MSVDVLAKAPPGPEAPPSRTRWSRVLRRLLGQPVTVACGLYLLALVVVAVAAPALAPYPPDKVDLAVRLTGPSGDHWLGTDELGRDQLSRMMYGARVALQASFQAVALGVVVGVPLGLLIGYLGGWWDRIAMRLADVAGSIPTLLFAFAIIAALGRGLTNAMLAISIVFALNLLRITRGAVLIERERPYVDSARVLGLGSPRIMFGQILPNVAGPLVVQASIFLGLAQLFEAMLSFLGLGVDTGTASWGQMLDKARTYTAEQPWLPVFPGVAITGTVLAFNLFGDGLRDALGREGATALPWGRSRRGPLLARQEDGAGADGRALVTNSEPSPEPNGTALLSVRGLSVRFPGQGGPPVTVVDDVSFDVAEGEVFGLVGESGSGKTMTALSAAGLVPSPGTITARSIRLDGRELTGLSDDELTGIRGRGIAMIFQDPQDALSPVHTVGRQICEPLRTHAGLSKKEARERAAELLALAGVPDARRRLADYPHQFSGGMAQRVMIAQALACDPRLLIADEPTTALDVTVQRQVLDLLLDLRGRFGMSILLITHDLGVVADVCDRVAVMYAGQVVETASTERLFSAPRHPYTAALLAATPRGEEVAGELPTLPGTVPPPWAQPDGCRFHPRCDFAVGACAAAAVPLENGSRCLRRDELALGRSRP